MEKTQIMLPSSGYEVFFNEIKAVLHTLHMIKHHYISRCESFMKLIVDNTRKYFITLELLITRSKKHLFKHLRLFT